MTAKITAKQTHATFEPPADDAARARARAHMEAPGTMAALEACGGWEALADAEVSQQTASRKNADRVRRQIAAEQRGPAR